MSARERHLLADASAESSLSGWAASAPHDERLGEVLAAAAGPATEDELAGEQSALMAFSRAQLGAARGSRHGFGSRLTRWFASKTTVAALMGSVAAGGAFASAGDVPHPFSGPETDVPPPVSPATSPSHTPEPGAEDEHATEPAAPPAEFSTPAPSTGPSDEAPSHDAPAVSSDTATDPADSSLPTEDAPVPDSPVDEPTVEPELPVRPPAEPPNVPDDLPDELDDDLGL